MASVFKAAVQQELENQSIFARYKGTFLIVASGAAGILSQLALSPDFADTQWAVALTTIATIIAALVNRFTKDGVAPSAVKKLEQAGMEAFMERPMVTNPVDYEEPAAGTVGAHAAPEADPVLPIYDDDSTQGA